MVAFPPIFVLRRGGADGRLRRGTCLRVGGMLKARGEDANGEPIMLLGLSGENVTRLAAGEAILFNASELGLPPCQVAIMYGRTERDILDELARHGRVHVRRAGG